MRYVSDTLGSEGSWTDPTWQLTVQLSDLERDLLRTWWVRRLHFVAHAGAAAAVTTQNYTRLEHSLGVLALMAHFHPDDHPARAAALVHDIGHLPLSHTFENVAGLDHHDLGEQRLRTLAAVFARHDPDGVATLVAAHLGGHTASPLTPGAGELGLDHLDSFVRSARSHGRLSLNPRDLLDRLHLVDGTVHCDLATGRQIGDLVVAEARAQTAPVNVLATGLVRHWATLPLHDASPLQRDRIVAMTDDEFWTLLLTDPSTCEDVRQFRRDPQQWTVTRQPRGAAAADGATAYTTHRIERLYLSLPLVDDAGPERPTQAFGNVFDDLPPTPLDHVIARAVPSAGLAG